MATSAAGKPTNSANNGMKRRAISSSGNETSVFCTVTIGSIEYRQAKERLLAKLSREPVMGNSLFANDQTDSNICREANS